MELYKNENINTMNVNKNTVSDKTQVVEEKPKTPFMYLLSIKELKNRDNDNLSTDFELLVKQIIETNDSQFLNGDNNVMKYILSKQLKITEEEFSKIERITLRVNEEFSLFDELGRNAPNLVDFNLSNSRIETISDLGTNFSKLQILNVSNCFLKDLSGKT